ncbi:major facilitator superfamily domain-containing protein 9-like isoform X1 [Planococcus citri]|uniref:major facilitator superfamily domain-containing protein 9-like isoform X1 n=1 Tax=Planococcus citri TaxID=170843 RepID=UPI0031F7D6A8
MNNVRSKLLYVISYVDVLAVSLIIPLFNQHLQSMGISNVKIGLLGSIYSAVQFFASPIIGHTSDVYGSKRVLIVTLLTCSICYPIMGQATTFIAMLTIRPIIGFAKHTQLLCKNYIQESTDDEKEHFRIFGNLNGFTSLGYIIGPVISGYLINTENGYSNMCCVTGILFAVNALISYFLQIKSKKKPSQRRSTNFITSFKHIPWATCWDLFLLKCLAVFAMFSFYLNYHTAMTTRFGTTSVQNGYSLSLQGLVRALAAFFIHKIFELFPNHLNTSHRMRIIYGILIVTFSALYLSSSFYLFLVFLVPLNVCLCFIRIVNHDALVERIKDHQKGIILGAFNNVTAVCRFILPLCSGYIVDVFGYDGSYLISILSLVVGLIVISMYSVRQKVD